MKKSILAVLLIISIVFILAGCSSNSQNTVKSSSESTSSLIASSSKSASTVITCSSTSALSNLEKPTVKLGDVTAAVGDTVKIPVTVSANAGIAATDMYIYFDSSKFKYVTQNIGKGYSGGIFDGNETESGKVKITLATLTVPTDECEMYTVSFEVLDGATGKNDFKLEMYTCYESDAKTVIDCNTVNGSVTVK